MVTSQQTRLHRVLAAHPSSVGTARRLVRAVLTDADRLELEEGATLVVSELVTNALVHAGTAIGLGLELSEERLRIEVDDGNPQLPSLRSHTSLTTTGRGLSLIEHLVDRWGVRPHSGGKVVWCDIGADPETDRPAQVMEPPDDIPITHIDEDTAHIELRNVPLLLHAAWQIHAESLLREMLLIDLDEDDAEATTSSVEAHAAASEAIALLRDSIPAPPLRSDPDSVMAEAVEPHVSARRLVLGIPVSTLRRFEVLDRTMERAVAMADEGALLSPPTQPELRTFRRWLCGEVLGQSAGRRPRAWLDVTLPQADIDVEALPWDTATVDDASEALIAADDHNRIVAVSEAALELLGYQRREHLVGYRLVTIVPSRYRQAHLAGFTLHLFGGRSPLLGTPITVPVRCNDGSERELELLVTPHSLAHGRKIFVAHMREPQDQ